MGFSKLDLGGRVAVVIGGTSGIGRAISHGLAEAGADVVCTSRRIEQVETAAAEIEDFGRRTLRVASDVSDKQSLSNLLDQCVAAFGKVDILVNFEVRRGCGTTTSSADSSSQSSDDSSFRHGYLE